MKLAILSDIHGNYTALKAVLEDVKNEGIKKLLCLGDYVGYYYEPEKCMDLLFQWDIECVRGNHENMLFEIIKDSNLLKYYKNRHGSGIEKALKKLNSKHLNFLKNLPETFEILINDFTFILCHGSPWDVNHYLYPDVKLSEFERCASLGKDFVLVGHTHRQMIKKINSTVIINPGSVGQPRDKNKGACWALLDLEKKEYILKTTKYNPKNETEQVNNNDPLKTQLAKYLAF